MYSPHSAPLLSAPRKLHIQMHLKVRVVQSSSVCKEASNNFFQHRHHCSFGIMNENPISILVVNDDGITAKGIQYLIHAMLPLGKITVVAPDRPQSGMGHAVTIHGIIRAKRHELSFGSEVQSYTCSGTPVDAVKLALAHIMPQRPDLIVSGINHGSNSSINVIYSGTMSAAVEGAIEGIPSIGFSLLDWDANADFEASAHFAQIIAQNVLQNGLPKNTCLNVNIPNVKLESIKGIKICRQAKAIWKENFEKRTDPMGHEYFWMTGNFVNLDHGEDTDEFALAHNYVSVVPVQHDMTAYHCMQELNNWTY
jgi:5'-nucleotidase